MKNIQIDDGLFVDKETINKNQDMNYYVMSKKGSRFCYKCKDLIKAWNRYEIELKKIRKVVI